MNDTNNQALLDAASAGDVDRIDELLESGADPNARIGDFENEAGKMPLGQAVLAGHSDAAMLLLDRGASLESTGFGGCDLVTSALLAGHLRLADRLYQRGARTRLLIGLCFAGNHAAIHEILHRQPERWGEYFLDSIRCGSLDMLEENIQRNPDPDQIKRVSLIHSAIFQWRLVHWFPRQVDGVDDGFDRTTYQRIMKRLLDWGMDPNLCGGDSVTPLHKCATANRPWSPTDEERVAHARLLIDAGADLNARDTDDCTPLARAVEHKRAPLIELLTRHGAIR